ncbi:MAG: magnesium and cobalt transport protein CorA [Burkholderiales bacterium]|nr:MAG: magnesium and cobalt transport protein CorA [Betaproteobacteria bacterium]TAG24100.1 MAG: magnesium and cobalt transport protein CorA [Burkholderiales bacterium]
MLINCAAYVNGVNQGDLDIEAISDFLDAKQPDGSFVWVALLEPDALMLAKMQEEFGLHELAIEDTNRGSQRPKLEEYGNTLFLIVHTIERKGDEFIDGELHIYAGEKFVLTVRHRVTTDFRKVRTELEREPAFLAQGPGSAVHGLLDEVVDRFFPLLADLEERLDALEETIFASTTDRRAAAEKLYELKRDTMCLRRAVTPLEEICQRLVSHKHIMIRDDLRPYFRDVLDHVTRIDESLDNLRDMENSAAQTNLSLITLQESEITKRLAGWGAIFMVPTIIGSIYGMNFKHMPELEWAFGYPFALALMAGGSVGLWWFFRRIRWV